MIAAIETLVNKRNRKGVHERDWKKLKKILGKELAKDLFFGKKGCTDDALRNRLMHGRYFAPEHGEKHHVNLLHQSIITYFNKVILKEDLVEESVVNPQRHPFGNRDVGHSFIRAHENAMFALPRVLTDMDANYNFTHYERIVDNNLWSTY
jgi:hypothetical protein